VFEESVTTYSSALKYLGKNDFDSALEKWKLTTKALTPLTFQEDKEIQYAKLNYEMLLLQGHLTALSLKELMKSFEDLKVEKEQTAYLKKVKISINQGLQALEAKKMEEAQFFLVAGFGQLHSLFKEKNSSPAAVLTQALELAKNAMQLFLLAQLLSEEVIEQVHTILKEQESITLIEAELFIPTVLNAQNDLFHQNKNLDERCQQSPWDRVIPLFDRGCRLGKSNQELMNKNSFDLGTLITNQANAIKDWREALNLILHPHKQQSSEEAPQKWRETFRQIQEMYLEDQSKPEEVTKELHAW